MPEQHHSTTGAIALGFAASFLQTSTFQLVRSFQGLHNCSPNASDNSSFDGPKGTHSHLWNSSLHYGLLTQNLIAMLPCVVLPPWSDKHGRKLLLILPLLGLVLYDVHIIAFSFFSSVPAYWTLFPLVSYGLCGTASLSTVGCICYLTDRTDFRSRTWYLGLLFCTIYVGQGIGKFVPRICDFRESGFSLARLVLIVFFTKIMIEILLAIAVKVMLSESVFMMGDFNGNPWRNVIAPINVADAFNSVFKKRISNVRLFIVISLTTFCFWCTVWYGNEEVIPIYLARSFQWKSSGVEMLWGLGVLALSFITLVVVGVAKAFNFLDASLGIAGCISSTVCCLLLAISSSGFTVCAALSCGILTLTIPISVISILSKLAEHNETGGMFAGIGFVNLVMQLIATISYHQLQGLCFAAHIPGVVFLLSFGISSLGLFHFMYLRRNIPPELVGHISFEERMLLLGRRRSEEAVF